MCADCVSARGVSAKPSKLELDETGPAPIGIRRHRFHDLPGLRKADVAGAVRWAFEQSKTISKCRSASQHRPTTPLVDDCAPVGGRATIFGTGFVPGGNEMHWSQALRKGSLSGVFVATTSVCVALLLRSLLFQRWHGP
jgi:hypothetical protein